MSSRVENMKCTGNDMSGLASDVIVKCVARNGLDRMRGWRGAVGAGSFVECYIGVLL